MPTDFWPLSASTIILLGYELDSVTNQRDELQFKLYHPSLHSVLPKKEKKLQKLAF